MSCGSGAPSTIWSPAVIFSPSLTKICFDLGTKYSLGSPTDGVTIILFWP